MTRREKRKLARTGAGGCYGQNVTIGVLGGMTLFLLAAVYFTGASPDGGVSWR
jgi:hypothetical protein